jgi:L-alanine-DL-glutamate epimerase-like enolase superfamily enzyme
MNDHARLTWQEISLRLKNPFRVSYGASTTRVANWIRLENDEGWGEGTIPPYYGIGAEQMIRCWQEAAQRSAPFPDDPRQIANWVGEDGPAPARCALDLALHDRIGRHRQQPLFRLLDLPQPQPMPTAITIGIDTPEEMARQARVLASYPILKLKLGSDDDEARLAAVRAVRPDARLFIDANAAWQPVEAVDRLQALLPYELELVEQPVARDDIDGMGQVQAHLNVPVVADESVRTLEDIRRLAAAGVQAINVKLMKVGGLGPALGMIRLARKAGLRVMLGCMIETAIGVTAVAHLSGLADWLDLDAPLLVANDPFRGVAYDEHGCVLHPLQPGIGVELEVLS